ncbi:MAG: hypothetical protein QW692_00640 [Nitrososphaerota archaeon]
MSGRPDLGKLAAKLYDHAMRLAEELDEVVDEDERKWRYDVLTKIVSPLVKLLEILREEGELSEDDLVKILSGLASRGLMSHVVLDDFSGARRFLELCLAYFERKGDREKAEEMRQLIREYEELRAKVKFVIQSLRA